MSGGDPEETTGFELGYVVTSWRAAWGNRSFRPVEGPLWTSGHTWSVAFVLFGLVLIQEKSCRVLKTTHFPKKPYYYFIHTYEPAMIELPLQK